ncbi:MAG: Lipopolysaccharide export system protein LptA [Verrucomicrobiae bacterium]|nr:Lipopolysaccharide export system protein LptA [Verrucomicrobiae bacterium]
MKLLLITLALTAGIAAVVISATNNEPTVVTSDRMQTDYASNVGTFEGNVLVTDPRITVRSDKMVVFFGGTNTTRSVQRIIATGGVVINQDKKKATADRAEYTTTDSKVVLTDNPKVEGPEGIVTGKKITLWHGQEKMDVETDAADTNRTRLIIYPEELRKQNRESP